MNNWSSDERKVLTDLTGWHGSTFVTQSYNVGEKKGEFEFYSKELSVQLKEKGTLDEWNAGIARFARGNSRIMICMALSLTGPLLKLHGLQNFGIHLFGPSSCGKSTCSKIAASVWSNPNKPNPFVQTWRATGIALE